jgi:LPXTG-motif cell wall-anchored protein
LNETPNPITCVPNCGNIECGADNGCGEMCWSCIEGETCDVETNKCAKHSNFNWNWVILGLIVVILAGVGYYFFVFRKKK